MKKVILLSIWFLFFIHFSIGQNLSELNDSLLIIKLQNAGVAAGRLGDFDSAIKNFNEIYLLRKKIYGANSYRLASLLNNLGIQYKNLGDYDRAIESYKKAEELYVNEFGDSYSKLGIIHTNLGLIFSLKGDFNQALDYYQNAYRVLKEDSVKLNDNFQVSKFNIADAQLKLGFNLDVIRSLKSNIKTTSPDLKPRSYDLIATAYKNLGQYELSEKYYLIAIQSWIDLYGNDNIELISEYLSYSGFLMSQKNYEKALLYTSKAKSIVLKFFGEKSTTFAEVQSNFGDYFYLKNVEVKQFEDSRTQRKKYLNQAIQYYQESIISLVDSFNTKDPSVNPPLRNVISEIQLLESIKKKAMAMEKLADIYFSEFDYKNSMKYFDASLDALSSSVELIHRLQVGFENEDSKLFLSQNQESTFYEAIKIAFKLYSQTKKSIYIERAFELSERSKSSNLLASVKDVKAKEFAGIPDSLMKKENYLKSNIANYTSMLFEENHSVKPDSQKVNLFSGKIFKYNEEYNALVNSFEESYPQYFTLKYENKVAGIGEVQSRLSARQALVEYFVKEPEDNNREGELYRFVITRDSVSFGRENLDYSYVNYIETVHGFLTNPNYLYTKKKDFVAYSLAAYGLYEKLLQPVENGLKGKSMSIIPHDKLSYIPFDALLSQMPDTSSMNFRNLNYLIRDYAISYSYSATLLFDYFKQKKKSGKNAIIFSPKYIANEPRIDVESSVPNFFSPLPGAKEEVKAVSRFVRADSFVDAAAQEDIFKEKASEYDIMHLAMHTVINDSLPMFSKLIFSVPNKGSDNDGYLNTYEIYNMKLNARLAVLSACETGAGKLQKGEGVMSMARGFIFAGCPSIVMTLWQVEDKSGVQIMADFYNYLSKGKRKDVALRMAKLKHLENSDPLTAHPHFWLGYVNVGNTDPLYTSKDVYFIGFLIVVILIVFADWYFKKKPGKKRKRIKI